MIPSWVSDYVGLPFSRYNCWQLVCKVYAEVYGIRLPSFDPEYKDYLDGENIKRIYEREMQHTWTRQDIPVIGDCVVMNIKNQPWHVGVIVSRNQMLHTERGLEAVIERFTGPQWKNNIVGFYRYKHIY